MPAAVNNTPSSQKSLPLLVPSRATLAAIKRINAGQGVILTVEEHLMNLAGIFPEHRDMILDYIEIQKRNTAKLTETTGSPSVSALAIKIRMDKAYLSKLCRLKKYHDLTETELGWYVCNTTVIALGGRPRAQFKDQPLANKGVPDLRGYRSFMVRKDPRNSRPIICLYTISKGPGVYSILNDMVLTLCDIGAHDKVYASNPGHKGGRNEENMKPGGQP
jgi:hypothetical protein